MKRILFVALALAGMALQAQTMTNVEQTNLPKNELKVSVGAWPIVDISQAYCNVVVKINPFKYSKDYFYSDNRKITNRLVIPCFSLSYSRLINERNSIAVACSWGARVLEYYVADEDGQYIRKTDNPYDGTTHYISLHCGIRHVYSRHDNFTLYGSLFAGGSVWVVPNSICDQGRVRNSTHVTFNIAPIGISFGERNCFNMELGFGTQGLLNMGYSRRF